MKEENILLASMEDIVALKDGEIARDKPQVAKIQFLVQPTNVPCHVEFVTLDELEISKLVLLSFFPSLPIALPNASSWAFLLHSHFKTLDLVFSNQARLMKNKKRISEENLILGVIFTLEILYYLVHLGNVETSDSNNVLILLYFILYYMLFPQASYI